MIYLDNSATTQPFEAVVEAVTRAMREAYYNVSAAYGPAIEAERSVRACRVQIACELGAQEDGVIFTAGGTESDNLSILGVAQGLRAPANFVMSAVEHPAVSETMRRLERMGHEVRILPVDARGVVDLHAAQRLIDDHTALVSCMQVCNETGAIEPVSALSRMAKERNPRALMHVDGVQGFMRVPLHMGRDGVDLYSLSAHKIHGPKGVGALVLQRGVRPVAQQTGGGQEHGLRSGTLNGEGIVGLLAAMREIANRRGEVEAMRRMKVRLLKGLAGMEGVHVNGPLPGEPDSAPHILSLSFDGVRGEVLRNALEGEGVLVSTGSACSSHKQRTSTVLEAMGLTGERADGTIRISFGLLNRPDEVDEAAQKISGQVIALRRFRRR